MNDTVNMSKEQVTEIPAHSQYAGEQTICEDCGRVWIVECNNEDINLCLDKENFKEIKKPTFILTVLREETDPLAKVVSLNSPARLTCIVICPKDKYAYQWKVNHKGKGSAAYSGCKLDPALHGPRDLRKKDSQISDFSNESITTLKPLNRKKRKIWTDESDMRTEKSDINSDVRKENSIINVGVRTEDVLRTENTIHSKSIYETITSDIDDRNVDCAVKIEMEKDEIKEESLMEDITDLVEDTDQCMDLLDSSTSVPEPNTKGPEFLGSQEGKLQHTNMGGTLIVPLLNCPDMIVQAQNGQEMQAAGQNVHMAQPQTYQDMQAEGPSAQIAQPQIDQKMQAAGQMVQPQIDQEMPDTGQNENTQKVPCPEKAYAFESWLRVISISRGNPEVIQACMVQPQFGQETQATEENAQTAQIQSGQEMQAAEMSTQMAQTLSGEEILPKCKICKMVFKNDYLLLKHVKEKATEENAETAQIQSGQEMQAAEMSAQMAQTLSGEEILPKCKICKIVFKNDCLLMKHVKEQNHPACTICSNYFTTDTTLKRHVRDYHYKNMSDDIKAEAIVKTGVSEVIRKNKTRIKCFNDSCMVNGTYFNTLNKLRDHMQHIHNEDHSYITQTFDTFEDFKTWKDEEEGRIGANYCKTRGSNNQTKSNTRKTCFFCKRSGAFTTRGQGKRILKSKGSVKIGSTCTSTMEVKECNKTKKISVTYYSKHSGHEMDIHNLMHNTLCQIDKEKIADKLRQGVPRSCILEEVRETANNDRGKYINRQDIHNVALEFGLSK